MDRSAIAWRGEYGAADKPVNAKFLPDTASLKRAATLPTRLQLPQLVPNFERIRNIDLRRRILGGGDGLEINRRPLLEVAGTDCNRRLCAVRRVHFALHAGQAGRCPVTLNAKQAVPVRRNSYRWRTDRKL